MTIKAAGILIEYKDGIVLQKRDSTYKYANQWTIFGGGLRHYETPLECAKRELKEELNLETELKFMCTYHFGSDIDNETLAIYTTKIDDLSKLALTEGAGFAVFEKEEIKDLLTPNKDLFNLYFGK